jgi:hypothetical protein
LYFSGPTATFAQHDTREIATAATGEVSRPVSKLSNKDPFDHNGPAFDRPASM